MTNGKQRRGLEFVLAGVAFVIGAMLCLLLTPPPIGAILLVGLVGVVLIAIGLITGRGNSTS